MKPSMKPRLLALLPAAALVTFCALVFAGSAFAAALTFTTSESRFDSHTRNQGWWSATASNFDDNDNYFVGSDESSRLRNFFTFHLTGSCANVQAARLELTRFNDTNNGTVTYGLFDVSTAADVLNENVGTSGAIFDDLGTGTSYGTYTIDLDTGSATDLLSFPLNAAGVAAVAAARDQFLSIGGALTDPQDGQFVAGRGEASMYWFSGEEVGTQQLVVECSSYTLAGLSEPISNSELNTARAGQSVPVKYRVTEGNGDPVSDPAHFGSVTSQSGSGSCSGLPSDAVEEYSGGSGLQYLGDGYWQYNWKTPKSYAGQCRTMTLTLSDQQTKVAAFEFK